MKFQFQHPYQLCYNRHVAFPDNNGFVAQIEQELNYGTLWMRAQPLSTQSRQRPH